jgi:tetratricopeptide (TPR) repeat protein
MTAVGQLLDRLMASDEAPFAATWIEAVVAGRTRVDPGLSVRLLRAYRESGRLDRARDLAATLPSAPGGWGVLDAARLCVERATIAMIDGRPDHAESELRGASRALGQTPRGSGLREQLDMHLAAAQLDIRRSRIPAATSALRLAEHVAERLEDGAGRVPVAMILGHLSMRIADPRSAAKHYTIALARAPARGMAALAAHGNLAIALGSIGRFDDGRLHAQQAIGIASELAAGWRHADAHDILAIVEIAADRPQGALHAIDEALVVLGDLDHPTLRYQLAEHRTLALAMLGRAQAARQWLQRADKLRGELSDVDATDAQDLVATRSRTAEASGQLHEAISIALPVVEHLPDAFVTGSLNLVVARAALAIGDVTTARLAVERAALNGDRHGWVFPERASSGAVWALASRSGDSRVVRYAERIARLVAAGGSVPPGSTGDRRQGDSEVPRTWPSRPELHSAREGGLPAAPDTAPQVDLAAVDPDFAPFESDTLIYVTTEQGVSRVRRGDLARVTADAELVVDTLTHALRVKDRAVSLERRRALEPLVVQLLRRAREGLSAPEVLRAAGGPGPESADAEHRVRVLISRVRDLIGDAAAIERVRDAGEYGKTRYRLAVGVRFALVEPLYAPESR